MQKCGFMGYAKYLPHFHSWQLVTLDTFLWHSQVAKLPQVGHGLSLNWENINVQWCMVLSQPPFILKGRYKSHTCVCHRYLRLTCVCRRYLWHTHASNDWGIISAANTSMLQISGRHKYAANICRIYEYDSCISLWEWEEWKNYVFRVHNHLMWEHCKLQWNLPSGSTLYIWVIYLIHSFILFTYLINSGNDGTSYGTWVYSHLMWEHTISKLQWYLLSGSTLYIWVIYFIYLFYLLIYWIFNFYLIQEIMVYLTVHEYTAISCGNIAICNEIYLLDPLCIFGSFI